MINSLGEVCKASFALAEELAYGMGLATNQSGVPLGQQLALASTNVYHTGSGNANGRDGGAGDGGDGGGGGNGGDVNMSAGGSVGQNGEMGEDGGDGGAANRKSGGGGGGGAIQYSSANSAESILNLVGYGNPDATAANELISYEEFKLLLLSG
jgi:hypothetical protein